jgi:polysaccharide pyruvyl transferase CsaB
MEAQFDAIARFASIGDFIDQPVKTYSSGMVVRLAFAVAVHVTPDILIVDEALAVGDTPFQAKCLQRIRSMQESGVAILLVTHSTNAVIEFCERAIYLDRGRLIASGRSREIAERYANDVLAQEGGISISRGRTDVGPPAALTEVDSLHDPSSTRDARSDLISVTIADEVGNPKAAFRRGETALVLLTVRFNQPNHAPCFGMQIKSPDDIALWSGTTQMLGARLPAIALPAVLTFAWRFNTNFGGGRYVLALAVGDVETGEYRRHSRSHYAGHFDVLPEPSSGGGWLAPDILRVACGRTANLPTITKCTGTAPRMAPRLRALLAGFYGAANLGDEMILSVILDWLGQANAEAVVVSLNPAYTRVEFGVEAVSFDSLAEIAAVAATSDVFVLGGGGLFQDHHRFDVPSLYRFPAGTVSQYAQLLFLAAQHGLPTVALAQGVGPLRSIPVRDIVAEVFTRATRVSLRDAASAEILRAIGVDRDVIIAPDPGWCYEARPGQKKLAERFPELRERRTFIVVLREWDFVGGWEEPLSRALRQGLGAGDAIVWACFQRNAGDDVAVLTDDATIERVMAAAGNGVAHARWLDATLDEIVQAIAECAGVIAMRLHALLIAIRCGKPVIALEYDDKMRHLGDTAGLSDVMRVPLDRIADAMPQALRALTAGSNSVPRAAVERLIRDAGEHRDLLLMR